MPTIVAVTVSRAIKGKVAPDDIVFLFYPLARLRMEGGALCLATAGDPLLPRLGDELVAFPSVPAMREQPIFTVDPRRQVAVIRDGRAELPANIADELDETMTAEEILSEARLP